MNMAQEKRKYTLLRILVDKGLVPVEKVRGNPKVHNNDFTDV